MRGVQERSAAYVWASRFAFIFYSCASFESAGAQNAATGCEIPPGPVRPDSTVVISPQRGWQMEGREIEATITSTELGSNARVLVCFRWKDQSTPRKFVQADPIRIVQPAAANQPPRSLKVAAAVPNLGSWPINYKLDNSAPIAEIRFVLLDSVGKQVEDLLAAIAIVGSLDYCNVPNAGTRSDGGTVLPSGSKNWQPVGGEVELSVTSPKPIPGDAVVRVCFRWVLAEGNHGPFSDSDHIRVLERQPSTIRLAVQVPKMGDQPPRFKRNDGDLAGSYAIPHLLVPKADVRVLLFDTNLDLLFDAWTTIGITSVWFAVVLVLVIVLAAFGALWRVCYRRFPSFGKNKPVLSLITTRNGFASLSQFQIMLWTFVVIASAVYVIGLSGDLIPITAGTLVLLGISGASTVIAKAKNESDAAAAPPPVDPAFVAAEVVRADQEASAAELAAQLASGAAKADAELAAKELRAKAEAAKAKAEAVDASAAAARLRLAVNSAGSAEKPKAEQDAQAAEILADSKQKAAAIAASKVALVTRIRHPLWSDLVMEETRGRELDVTRVQMLFFTLVTALFVVIKVVTSYEIPVIPEGFLILMGISNGVYVGSKFAASPNIK